ncbi:MAG: hypothetical protein WD557_01955 [Dehalococcoidia bacterium]
MPTDPAAGLLDREGTIERLRSSLATVEWAVKLIPEGWTHRSGGPRSTHEAWSAAMNLAHLATYEETFPLTELEDLLSEGNGLGRLSSMSEEITQSRALALASEPISVILGHLQEARARQVGLAEEFPGASFTTPQTRAWGSSGLGPEWWSPALVLNKTFQHTWEHGNAILSIALFAPRELVED